MSSDNTDQNKASDTNPSNVINLFTRQLVDDEQQSNLVAIVAESRGTRMLYASHDHPERLVAVPILCWALQADGAIVGMVPWLDEVLACEEIEDKYSVSWEGYYLPQFDDIFFEPPEDTVAQLTVLSRFPSQTQRRVEQPGLDHSALAHQPLSFDVIQEIPDPVGTHALLLNEKNDSLILTSVISWALDSDGNLHGMLADDHTIEKLPVLPGDSCLFSAVSADKFKCFFQRDIAEQIRTKNPETLEAIEQLFAGQ